MYGLLLLESSKWDVMLPGMVLATTRLVFRPRSMVNFQGLNRYLCGFRFMLL
jgi:hypothetical protein